MNAFPCEICFILQRSVFTFGGGGGPAGRDMGRKLTGGAAREKKTPILKEKKIV
jgi:hypothetical protein